ncbi:protein phosphatase 2C domain-containing protein [Streptomyces sp. NPDC059224]|uniref:protein phosphatase 2C domain-containing protein n=1 Tax=Streptomyces sp. NPDC059224 TaxID=3346775 RepID=UPI003680F26C
MSQPGGRPARHEDDWWGQLYDDSTEDTGPTAAPDSLDDRFASAKNTVAGRGRRAAPEEPGTDPAPPAAPVPPDPPPVPPDPPPVPPAVPRRSGVPDASDSPAAPGPWTVPVQPSPPGSLAAAGPSAAGVPPVPAGPPGPPKVPASAAAGGPPPLPAPPAGREPSSGQQPPAVPAQRAAAGAPGEDAAPARKPWPWDEEDPESAEAEDDAWAGAHPATRPDLAAPPPYSAPASSVEYVGSGPPTYDAEPTALPAADPDGLDDLVADTVLDGARYGICTLRAVSQRGDSTRYRGEPRRDALLTARFGSGDRALLLVALATGARGAPGAHRAAAEVCQWIARAVGRSHQRLTEDIQAARRGDLKSGLHRLTDRSLGRLRAGAAERGVAADEYAASLRCLLVPTHPQCRTRVFFGAGEGGLFRLRDGEWQDIEPRAGTETVGEPVVGYGSPPAETPEGDRLTMDLGIPTPPSPYEPAPEPPRAPFLFRASVARPGDALVMCSGGLADPLRGEPALCAYLARRWSGGAPPGLAAFLADTQVRVKGYADDRTAAVVWEA